MAKRTYEPSEKVQLPEHIDKWDLLGHLEAEAMLALPMHESDPDWKYDQNWSRVRGYLDLPGATARGNSVADLRADESDWHRISRLSVTVYSSPSGYDRKINFTLFGYVRPLFDPQQLSISAESKDESEALGWVHMLTKRAQRYIDDHKPREPIEEPTSPQAEAPKLRNSPVVKWIFGILAAVLAAVIAGVILHALGVGG